MNKQVPIEVDDAIILLLGAPSDVPSLKNRIEGITRLEKLMFLLEKESDLRGILTEDAEFEPHQFGPFSSKIYQEVEILSAANLIDDSAKLAQSSEDTWEAEEIVGAEQSAQFVTRDISLTDRGRKYYDSLIADLPKGTEKSLKSFKAQFAGLPLSQLIRYVYQRHEPYTVNSIIKDQVLARVLTS